MQKAGSQKALTKSFCGCGSESAATLIKIRYELHSLPILNACIVIGHIPSAAEHESHL